MQSDQVRLIGACYSDSTIDHIGRSFFGLNARQNGFEGHAEAPPEQALITVYHRILGHEQETLSSIAPLVPKNLQSRQS